MATYFHGNSSEISGPGPGGDGLQTLILMNPAYAGYPDGGGQPPPPPPNQGGNFVFLNPNSAANSPHAPPPHAQHHFVGIPLQNSAAAAAAAAASPSSGSGHEQQDVSALHGYLPPRVHYSLYNLPVDLGQDVARAPQGLSLSLSSQHPPPGYGSFRGDRPDPVQPQPSPTRGDADGVRISAGPPSPASGVTNGVGGVQSVLLSSKYLKAAQELLEEVVNVGRGARGQPKTAGEASPPPPASGEGQGGGESSGKRGAAADLTTVERQEIQMKKAKLVNMLDEVEQRYRQYHHQMQIVISWFEQAAGVGSAKTYTALALQTISKQFRCLKDAILGQIKAASKSLGEEDNMEGKLEGSRLKYVDNQIRQQRALQQLGMIQHNAWRPQRGLPERSVSVLRAWLFEHFLHPYPKDSDKLMLAKQTGLTRSQVSNWFINARVRLWKPMVEEMYMEEMKEHEKNNTDHNNNNNNNNKTSKIEQSNNNTDDPTSKTPNQNPSPTNLTPQKHDEPPHTQNPPPIISISSPTPIPRHIPSGFNIIGPSSSPSEIEALSAQQSPKKLRFGPNMDETRARDRPGFGLIGGPTNFIGGFGAYPMGELGRFGPEQQQQQQQFHGGSGPYLGNGVSLTLGLPNIGAHQSFMQPGGGQGMQMGEAGEFGQTSTNVYESISIQGRKRFAAQLLPDFVA
ncbi:BEL1-like homeodomain 1 family protein [Striga asiatica]|uniref:BEL1-like homeodomain 1 family protein n=1 Tax=Striga asiatica TaxID=4170 RepID=A0A5A7P8R9_STRAF|nr:BEL1-like homeodomain 1 family protein [Striga asiatica]